MGKKLVKSSRLIGSGKNKRVSPRDTKRSAKKTTILNKALSKAGTTKTNGWSSFPNISPDVADEIKNTLDEYEQNERMMRYHRERMEQTKLDLDRYRDERERLREHNKNTDAVETRLRNASREYTDEMNAFREYRKKNRVLDERPREFGKIVRKEIGKGYRFDYEGPILIIKTPYSERASIESGDFDTETNIIAQLCYQSGILVDTAYPWAEISQNRSFIHNDIVYIIIDTSRWNGKSFKINRSTYEHF